MGNPSGAQATSGECCIKPRREDRLAYSVIRRIFIRVSYHYRALDDRSERLSSSLYLGMVVRLGCALLKAIGRKVVVVCALLVTVPTACSSGTRNRIPERVTYAPHLAASR